MHSCVLSECVCVIKRLGSGFRTWKIEPSFKLLPSGSRETSQPYFYWWNYYIQLSWIGILLWLPISICCHYLSTSVYISSQSIPFNLFLLFTLLFGLQNTNVSVLATLQKLKVLAQFWKYYRACSYFSFVFHFKQLHIFT